jgi:quercetin dioxygenase-like cupin family protein
MNIKEMVPNLPDGAPDIGEVLLATSDISWREKSLKGLYEKMLWRDESTGASIALIRFDKGVGIPKPHFHASDQCMFCLEGKYKYTASNVTLKPGSFYWNPKGNEHGPTIAHEDTVFLEIYDGPHYPQRPDWYDNDEDAL